MRTPDIAAIAESAGRPLAILALFYSVFVLFHKYDWNCADVKATCFLVLLLAVVCVSRDCGRASHGAKAGKSVYLAETLAYSCLFAYFVATYGAHYFPGFDLPSQSDVGYITHTALKVLFVDHADPYNTALKSAGNDPRFYGYTYGPAMMLFFAPSVFYSSAALKVISSAYLLLLLGVAFLILRRETPSSWALAASFAFFLALMFLSERFWHESLTQGATDILPIFLVMLSVYLVYRDKMLPAGLAAGLSFSAKFSPAVFFILLFVRRRPSKAFFGGVALGLLPMLAFLAWSGIGLIDNIFVFNAVKDADSTSLYSLVPAQYHLVFPAIQAAAVLFFLLYDFDREIDPRELLVHFTLLLIVIEMTYKEVHANHLIWFIPPIALIFALHMHGFAENRNGHSIRTR